MSEFADMSGPLINAVVQEVPNDVHPNRVALEKQQRVVEEGSTGTQSA